MVYTFFIRDLYDTTEVNEPRGWKDLMNVLDRDFSTHGVFFKYSDGALKLGFACDGKLLLEAAYQADGTEAFYEFLVNEDGVNIFTSQLDFNTRHYDEDYFESEVNQTDNLVKIKNRISLRTNFNKQLTHDGVVVSKLNSQDITLLATKTFRQLRVQQTGITVSDQSSALMTTTVMRGQNGYDITESIELGEFTNIDSIFQFDDVDTFLTLTKRSGITFNVEFDFDLDITEDQGSGTTGYTINLTLLSDKKSKEGLNSWLIWDGGTPSGASPFNHSDTAYGSVGNGPLVFYNGDFEAGTSFKLQLFISMGTTGTAQFSVDWTIRNLQLIFVDYRADLGTVSKCYNLHDSLNKTLNFITGVYDYLYSELLGNQDRGYDANGCFSTMRQTNGFRIRQINEDSKAPVESLKGFLDNLDAPGAIGYGIEELESPTNLGAFRIQWIITDPVFYGIWIMDVNLIYDIYVGTKISFYNSEDLFGTYEVRSILWNDFLQVTAITVFITDTNLDFPISTFFYDVIVTSDSETEFRDRFRLEKWEHFYGDSELIDLGVVQEYSEEPFESILVNEFNYGFRKFANDEDKPTTLEDFETESSWGTPLTKSDNKLNKIMSWIMSTFMINESRATLFNEKPTTSHKLDNNIFLFDVNDAELSTTATFVHNVSSDDTIEVDANTYENYIRDTGLFTVEDATIPGNNKNYLYDWTLVTHNLQQDTYIVNIAPATVTSDSNDPCTIIGYTGDIVQLIRAVKAEATEKLTSSSGLSGPDYTYNQRRTMKRFLIRWGRYINSVLGYISDSIQAIQNLVYVNNGELSTELDTSLLSDDCLMGDSSGAVVNEIENINTDAFPTAKFKPNFINCTVKICDTDYANILSAHKNRLLTRGIAFDGIINGSTSYNKLFEIPYFTIELVFDYPNIPPLGVNYLFSIGSHFFVYVSGSANIQVRFKPDGLGEKVFTFLLSLLNQESNKLKIDSKFLNSTTIEVTAFLNDIDVGSLQFTSINYDYDQSNGVFIASSHLSANIAEFKLFKFQYTSLDEDGEEINKLINLDIANGNNIEVSNKGVNAPANTNLIFSALPAYINQDIGDNYGFFTTESPEGNTKTGWLMNMKRNPVDRIAKIKLLERAP